MRIILHIPKDKEKLNELRNKVAKIHGSAIKYKVENLKCSKSQKIKLLDEIIKNYNKIR